MMWGGFMLFSGSAPAPEADIEKGSLSIYFMQEKVGYEEYTWKDHDRGFQLNVKGRMTKPIPLEIEEISLVLSKDFIPLEYSFQGSINGMRQEVSCSIRDGKVDSLIVAAGQERERSLSIKRDAFILPNPVFSPYMVLTKKYRCTAAKPIDLSAYIIPQMEIPFRLEPVDETPCRIRLIMEGREVEIETDSQGKLLEFLSPTQKLRVLRDETE